MGSRWRGCSGSPPNLEPWEEMESDSCLQTGVLWLQRLEGTRAKTLVTWARPVLEMGGRTRTEPRSLQEATPVRGGARETCRQGQSVASRPREPRQTAPLATRAGGAWRQEVWGKMMSLCSDMWKPLR